MNMPMVMTASVAAGGSGTAAGLAGKGTPATAPGIPGFASKLNQAIDGGKPKSDSLNELTLTLAALLGGLLQGPQALQATAPDKTGQESAAPQQAADALQGNSALLQKLLAAPGMQDWLKKAELLLQGLGESTANTGVSDGLFAAQLQDDPMKQLSQPQAGGSQQAGNLVLQLLQAAGQNPQSSLLSELVQDLAAMLGNGEPEPGQQVGSNSKRTTALNTNSSDSASSLPTTSGARMPIAKPMSLTEAAVQTAADPSKPIANVVFSVKSATSNPVSLVKLAALTQLQFPRLHSLNDASPNAQHPAATGANQVDSGNLLPLLSPLDGNAPLGMGATAALPELPTSEGSFVQDMSQFVLKNFKLIESGSVSEAKLSLSPAHLGQVDVKITMQDGQIAAQFLAQTSTGKELIEGQLAQLRTALQNMGLQVDRIDVSQNAQLSSNLFQDGRNAQQSFQQQSRKQKDQPDRLFVPDPLALEPTTIGELRSLVQSGGFNATA